MTDLQTIRQIKSRLVAGLKRRIRPHLWKSGYEDTMVFVFCSKRHVDDGHHVVDSNRVIKRAMLEDLHCFQGFYSDGVFDAHGGGMALISFDSMCVEDLLLIESWMQKNFDKEVALHKSR